MLLRGVQGRARRRLHSRIDPELRLPLQAEGQGEGAGQAAGRGGDHEAAEIGVHLQGDREAGGADGVAGLQSVAKGP